MQCSIWLLLGWMAILSQARKSPNFGDNHHNFKEKWNRIQTKIHQGPGPNRPDRDEKESVHLSLINTQQGWHEDDEPDAYEENSNSDVWGHTVEQTMEFRPDWRQEHRERGNSEQPPPPRETEEKNDFLDMNMGDRYMSRGRCHVERLNEPIQNNRAKATRLRVDGMVDELMKNHRTESEPDFRGNTLQKLQEIRDRNGNKFVKMGQRYNGFVVLGAEVVEHDVVESDIEVLDKLTGRPSGQRLHVNAQKQKAGRFVDNIDKDVGAVSPQQFDSSGALESFKIRGRHTFYQDERKISASESDTVIYVDDISGKAKVVHYVSYTVSSDNGPPSVPSALVDLDGIVVKEWDGLKTTVVSMGTGPGGNVKTGNHQYGTGELRKLKVRQQGSQCIFDTDEVKTIDLNQEWSTAKTEPYSFRCPSNNGEDGINGAYSPLNDAHYYGQQVFEMYNQWYGTPPLDGALTLQVHYGQNYENAFWDSSTKTMTFGDGQTIFYPLVALDVVAHEVSHGVTDRTSKLFYWGESGALNEAFSDMAGKAAERFVRGPASVNWNVGNDITKTSPLRCMDNPPCDGWSVDHVRSYQYGMNVHYGSGVFNKVFHLMASKMVFDVWDAFDIFYVANTKLWTSYTDFVTGAELLLRAAVEMKQGLHLPWGYSWVDISHIIDALNAVGLSCKPSGQYYTCEKVF